MIPTKLQTDGINFVLLEKRDKKPFQEKWQTKKIQYNNPELLRHIEEGGNYGVMGGGEKNLIILDFDDEKIQQEIIPKLPETLTVKTGRGLLHKYFFSDQSKSFKIFDNDMKTLLDVQGEGKQVVGAGSIHPNGNEYVVVEDKDIAHIHYNELRAILLPYEKKKKVVFTQQKISGYDGDSFLEMVKSRVKIRDVLGHFGIDTTKNPTTCYLHESSGGKCLSYLDDIAHCFHCQLDAEGWNIFSMVKDFKRCTFKEALEVLVDIGGLQDEYSKNKQRFLEEKADEFGKAIRFFTDKVHLASQFIKIQPVFYDKGKLWWLWNNNRKCWELSDETDILNNISKYSLANTVNSKDKNEILEALKQVGRLNSPEPIKPTWIQFNNAIVDILTEEIIEPSPKYFTTNPIPYKLTNDSSTPTMDRIFKEWVGEDYVKTLYEIIAYCLLPDYPLARLFCFVGSGMNGKSKYLELIIKFLGTHNCTSTELDTLLESRFEITRLHKKLCCQMGETNFNEICKTSILKKLTGGDFIGFEYKNKELFNDKNYAKILISTNNLPTTSDKTVGFYRRWNIIDFPNQFSEIKDILRDIPEEEYNNLTRKSIGLLQGLLRERRFHNEGTIEERTKVYEDKSNPLEKFWRENINVDSSNSDISKKQFMEKLEKWCKDNRFRNINEIAVGKFMKDKGVGTFRKVMEWVDVPIGHEKPRYWVWGGISWKN